MKAIFKVMLMAGASLPVVPALAQSSADTSVGIQDIVVTAQKREERLQDVPVAVSAITGEAIREQRIESAIDLGTLVPSLSTTPSLSGNQANFVMRGSLAANASNPTVDASVSQYIDGVYLGPLAGSLLDVSDIDRLEVIRGPAGTLFGTNATGGAINYITSRPKGEFYARQEVSYGRFDSFRAKTRLDLPEWNGFSVSLTYLHNYRGNNIRNIERFTFDTSGVSRDGIDRQTSARKLGWTKTDAFHGAVRYQPFDDLTVDYYFDYSKRREPGPGQQILGFVDGPTGLQVRGLLEFAAGLRGRTLDDYVRRSRSTEVYNALSTVATNTTQAHYLSAEYSANEFLTIKNTASWRQLKQAFRLNQLDAAGGLPDVMGFTDGLFNILGIGIGNTLNQFSNETQFIVDTEPFDLTAGLFYYTRHTRPGTFVQKIYSFTTFPASPEPGVDYVVPGFRVPGEEDTFFRTRQIAGYAQGTYHLTPQIDITGGIRYTQDSKLIFDGTGSTSTFDYDKGKFSYLANISYKPSDDVMVYAKYATGFVAGGLTYANAVLIDPGTGQSFSTSVGAPYQEERAKSAELGLKADFLDNRLRTNFALFHVDYSNLQLAFQLERPVIAPSGEPTVGRFSGIANIGKARVKGIEYEVTAVPVRGLTLSAIGAYNDFKYIDAPAFVGAPVLRPEFTANLSAEYEVPVVNDMRLVFRGDANYRSKVIVIAAYPFSEDPAVNPDGAALNEVANQPGLWKLNARVSLKDVPLGAARGQLSVWGRNLTNKQPLVAGGNLGTHIAGVFDDPVTYGVDLTVEF